MTTAISTRPTEPLRSEHLELLPHIRALADVADDVGTTDEAALWARIRDAHAFLAGHLAPHAAAEEAVLYPAVEAAMRAPGATATMRRDHVGVRDGIEQLGRELDNRGPLDASGVRRLRSLLYGLHAVISLHFEKEEEIYLEILDRALSPAQADDLFERLEAAAADARS